MRKVSVVELKQHNISSRRHNDMSAHKNLRKVLTATLCAVISINIHLKYDLVCNSPHDLKKKFSHKNYFEIIKFKPE